MVPRKGISVSYVLKRESVIFVRQTLCSVSVLLKILLRKNFSASYVQFMG